MVNRDEKSPHFYTLKLPTNHSSTFTNTVIWHKVLKVFVIMLSEFVMYIKIIWSYQCPEEECVREKYSEASHTEATLH